MGKKSQAIIEYFLLLLVLAVLTIIGASNLLDNERGKINRKVRNFYQEKVNQILGR